MNTPPIDATDRRIIQATQAGFPLTSMPYHAIATQLDLEPADVMARLQRMVNTGIIRRIGVIPNHYALGYRANGMTVWNVPDEQVQTLGCQIGALEFVSHCYQRPRYLPDWNYNLFAMVHGRDENSVKAQIQQISDLLGEYNHGHTVLYSTRLLKKTGFRLSD